MAALLVVTVASAQAASWHRLGTSIGPPVSDAVSRVAFEASPQAVTVVNTSTGKTATVPTPDGCATDPPDAATGLKAVHGTTVMWECVDSAGKNATLLDYRTGERQVVPLSSSVPPSLDVAPEEFGRRWLRVEVFGDHYDAHQLMSRQPPYRLDAQDKRSTYFDDLDVASHATRLCSPVRRFPIKPGALDSSRFTPFAFVHGVALTDTAGSGSVPRRLLVQRCGGKAHRLSACPDGCTNPQLSARYITWQDGQAGWLWDLRTRKRHRIAVGFRVLHTLQRVVRADVAGETWRIATRRPPG